MTFAHLQHGSLSLRGFAVCLVGMLSLLLWQSSAEATCGDYLMSHGESHQAAAASQNSSDSPAGNRLPFIPGGCPQGDCHSQNQAPEPVGSTSDLRIVDDLRTFGSLNALKAPSRSLSAGRHRPADDLLPESPFKAELERPPQFALV